MAPVGRYSKSPADPTPPVVFNSELSESISGIIQIVELIENEIFKGKDDFGFYIDDRFAFSERNPIAVKVGVDAIAKVNVRTIGLRIFHRRNTEEGRSGPQTCARVVSRWL
jgi:hypothetical protein